jgi:hypothetical protein
MTVADEAIGMSKRTSVLLFYSLVARQHASAFGHFGHVEGDIAATRAHVAQQCAAMKADS